LGESFYPLLAEFTTAPLHYTILFKLLEKQLHYWKNKKNLTSTEASIKTITLEVIGIPRTELRGF